MGSVLYSATGLGALGQAAFPFLSKNTYILQIRKVIGAGQGFLAEQVFIGSGEENVPMEHLFP